ncbi:MAG TPA: tetratricopeptide repeat protein [Proteobacteria bacterium]|nr:tetratricopeptide repeat protein [Pseudomonadota bacterium]
MKPKRVKSSVFVFLLVAWLSIAGGPVGQALAQGKEKVPSHLTAIWEKAAVNFQQGYYDEAIAACEKVIETGEDGDLAEKAYFLLADCYFYKYKPGRASHFLSIVEAYQTAIHKYPSSAEVPRAYLQLGLLYQEMGYDYEALAYFGLVGKNYKNTPYIPYAHFYQGKLCLSARQLDKAEGEFQKVISKFPQSKIIGEAYLGLIEVYIHRKSYEQAAQNLEKLLKFWPDAHQRWPLVLFFRGEVEMAARQYAPARADFLRYINITPNDDKDDLAIYKIAEVYEIEGKIQEAIKLYTFLTNFYPQSEGAVLARYRLIERIKWPDKTMQGGRVSFDARPYLDLTEKLRKYPLAEEAMARLALRYYEAGHAAESISWVQRFIERYPQSEYLASVLDVGQEALSSQARDFLSGRQYVEIINAYRKNDEVITRLKDGTFFYYLASAFRALGIYDSAAHFYYQANKLGVKGEEGLRVLLDWADTAQRKRDYRTAGILLKRLISSSGNKSILEEARDKLGQNYVLASEWREGAHYLAWLVKKNPGDRNPSLLYSWAYCTQRIGAEAETRNILNRLTPLLGEKNDSGSLKTRIAERWVDLGDRQKEKRQFEAAIKDYLAALALAVPPEKRHGIHYKLAGCYEALGKRAEAEAELTAITKTGDEFWKKVAQDRLQGIKLSLVR